MCRGNGGFELPPKPGTERAIVDGATDLQQEVSLLQKPQRALRRVKYLTVPEQ
jgi:hypothetical protein